MLVCCVLGNTGNSFHLLSELIAFGLGPEPESWAVCQGPPSCKRWSTMASRHSCLGLIFRQTMWELEFTSRTAQQWQWQVPFYMFSIFLNSFSWWLNYLFMVVLYLTANSSGEKCVTQVTFWLVTAPHTIHLVKKLQLHKASGEDFLPPE